MSKRNSTRQVYVCDRCEKEQDYAWHCVNCQQDYCFDCGEKSGEKFSAGVSHSGGGDGYYCFTCLALPKEKWNPHAYRLLEAHRKVSAIRREADAYYKQLGERREAVEQEVKDAYAKCGWLR